MSLLLVQGDNGVVVSGTVSDNGTPRNLTGASILVKFKVDNNATAHITGVADPDQVANPGRFTATLTSTHLATAGNVKAEVQVTDGANVITYESKAAVGGIVRPQL